MKKSINYSKIISVLISAAVILSMLSSLAYASVQAATYRTLTYTVGEADNIVGASSVNFERAVNTTFDVADSSRFSRKGYKLVSWYVPITGETIGTGAQYVMPDYDITFVANWEPVVYSVTFTGKGGKTADGSTNVYIDAKCGSRMVLPENEFIYDGYKFSGWKYNNIVYSPGSTFEVPALVTGQKIVFAAVWTADSIVTTAPETTTTTTTTTIIGQTVKTVEINRKLDFSSEDFKMYSFPIGDILDNATIEKVEFNIHSNIGTIDQVSIGLGANINGEWYQRTVNENINSTNYTIDFADEEICNNIDGEYIEIGYWWGSTIPLYIDSATIIYKTNEPEITSPVTTIPEYYATEETTTQLTTTTTTSVNTANSPYSRYIEMNQSISQNQSISIPSESIIKTNEIIESIEMKFRSPSDSLNKYVISIEYLKTDNTFERFDYDSSTSDNSFTAIAVIPEDIQKYIKSERLFNVGYWWGSNDNVILESIVVNYRIDSGDVNNDGTVNKSDVVALQKYLVKKTDICSDYADMNDDGIINIIDLIMLKKIVSET